MPHESASCFPTPRFESDKARPRVPSFYALEAIRAAEGRLPGFAELARRADETSPNAHGLARPERTPFRPSTTPNTICPSYVNCSLVLVKTRTAPPTTCSMPARVCGARCSSALGAGAPSGATSMAWSNQAAWRAKHWSLVMRT